MLMKVVMSGVCEIRFGSQPMAGQGVSLVRIPTSERGAVPTELYAVARTHPAVPTELYAVQGYTLQC